MAIRAERGDVKQATAKVSGDANDPRRRICQKQIRIP